MAVALLMSALSFLSPDHARAESRPVVLTSDATLAEARARLEAPTDLVAESWRKTRERAEEALTGEFVPYQGMEYLRYYRTGRDQAQFIRDLALVYHLTGEKRYGARGKELLLIWADEFHRLYDFPAHYPAVEIPHASGLVIGRTVLIFADAYALLWPLLDGEERERVENWFRGLVPPIKESFRLWEEGTYLTMGPPYFDRQFFNNHLGACNMGLAAIGFALRDRELISYAMDDQPEAQKRPMGEVERWNRRNLPVLIEGVIFMPGDFGSGEEGDVWHRDPSLQGAPPPLPGETYDRYRVLEGKGMHYALLHLRLLTLMAEMGKNNLNTPHFRGGNFFEFVGRRGESMRVSYEVYADWFIQGDPAAVNDGYYVTAVREGRPPESLARNLDSMALYELAARRYPESTKIREALRVQGEAGGRLSYDQETFAWSGPLLYAADEE